MLNRRLFLKVCSFSGLSWLMNPAKTFARPAGSVRLALLSDTHIPAIQAATPPKNHFYFDPQGNLIKALDKAIEIKPHGLIITGDIARLTGKKEDYSKFGELITPYADKVPFYPVMGNHDSRINFTDRLDDPHNGDYVNYKYIRILDLGFMKIINLDSMKETNYTPGFLGPEQLGWLERYLDLYNDSAVILTLHHPPDKGNLEDHEKFMDIILPRQKVKAVVFGHSHNPGFYSIEGLHGINLPATGYTFKETIPVGWVQADITKQHGKFTFHLINGPKPESPEKILEWR